MTDNRPYLVRALHEWICDNGLTPYLLVDAGVSGVRVPPQSVKEGRVVLNIAPRAVTRLDLANDVISFQARFSGVAMLVVVPLEAVLAVYAMENGQGMMFPPAGRDAGEAEADPDPDDGTGLPLRDAGSDLVSDDGGSAPEDPARPPRGGHLRIVK
ncbi:MAG: ClpXP protease specificity-enhancing factor [Xanthomonadales bacterium]|nr:ClpXP protease specificity-enhancing factor [Xanthomonadales bacterium]